MDRICIKCGSEMQPIKNGFIFMIGLEQMATSDLWGCKKCFRFQIHGMPNTSAIKVYGHVPSDSKIEADVRSDGSFWAILDPKILLTRNFVDHMKEWYSDWRIEEWESMLTTRLTGK